MTTFGAAEGLDDRGQNIVPVLHLDGEDRQAHAELYPDRLGSIRIALEEYEDLVSESRKFGRGNLRLEIVGNLEMSV
jgi:hypothetical protein